MVRVLVVDDEDGYRDYVGRALERAGHEVSTAANGHEGIEVGTSFRPDVLVVDWMLKDYIHGLHVSEVLRSVLPLLQTVLITGFPTQDLRAEARAGRIYRFIEKPFELGDIQGAVHHAADLEDVPAARFGVSVVELDARDNILYANRRAKELFATTRAGADATRLADLLSEEPADRLAVASQQWVEVRANSSSQDNVWHIRMRHWPNSDRRMMVVLTGEEQLYRSHPLVRMLLGLLEPANPAWPIEGRALIIDDEAIVRRVIVAECQRIGCLCHAAENRDVGLRLLERDPEINVVILDHDLPGGEIKPFVERMRLVRRNLIVVGTSTRYCREEFAVLGVSRFLLKPFVVGDLINCIMNRIGNCVHCGLPTPLRRPRPEEEARSWICCGCGARYYAILDESMPDDTHRNVQPAP
jgi:two-component system cell cycle response regulator CpdR